MKPRKILILDYSRDQFETPIIRNCLSKIHSVTSLFIDTEASFPNSLAQEDFTHIIHTGSALSITQDAPFMKKAMEYIRHANQIGVWQMGICFGHQLVCKALVGEDAVRASPNGFEVGWGTVHFTDTAVNLLGVKEKEKVWQHHFDEVIAVPEESEIWATNPHSKIQAYFNREKHLLGTQFHPEFDKATGNNYFLKDRKFIEKNKISVDELINDAPSFDSAKVFFEFFLKQEA